VGKIFGLAEDTDFLLALMSFGLRGMFDSSLHACHRCRGGLGINVDQSKGSECRLVSGKGNVSGEQ